MIVPKKLLLLLLFVHYPLVTGDIHPRAVGQVRKFCKNRRIEYNLRLDIHSKIPEINAGISLLSDICYNQRLNKICYRSIDNIKIEYDKFKSKWDIIELNDITKTIRRKRHVDNDLLQSNNVTAKILKKAMDLADQGYGDLRKKIEDIRKETTLIADSQNKLAEYVGYINFHSISQVLFEIIRQITDIADNILRLIVDNDTTSLIDLIDINNIEGQLAKLDRYALKSNCTIPYGTNSFQLAKFLKLCTFDIRILGNIISVGIKAPSVSLRVYTMLEPVSIPFAIKGSTYREKPLYDNILVHEEGFKVRTYVPLSAKERMECQELPDKKMICNPEEPMLRETRFNLGEYDYLFSANRDDCLTIEASKNIDNTRCPLEQLAHRNMLIQYERDLYKVYIVEPAKITIDCPERSTEYLFNVSRILPVPKACSVLMDDLLLIERIDIPAYDIIYLSNSTAGISISKKDLLETNKIETVNLTKEFRDLNPDFDEINNEIDQQIYRISDFLTKWRLKDEVLLSIVISLTISLILNWLTTCYYVRKLKKSQAVHYMEIPSKVPSSMKKLSPMKTFASRIQEIEKDFIKPINPPHSESLMLGLYDRQPSLPGELLLPTYPKPILESKSVDDSKIQTSWTFDPLTGQFETTEEILPPYPPPPPPLPYMANGNH